MVPRNYHLPQFCHKLPQFSQNGSTFDGFDDFVSLLAINCLKGKFINYIRQFFGFLTLIKVPLILLRNTILFKKLAFN